MSQPERRRPRPILAADVERLARDAGHGDPYARLELAHATAAVVVEAGRAEHGRPTEQFIRLVDEVGLDTLSELWRDAAADSLPGALWAIYLLQTWCGRQGESVARAYRAGRAYAPVDEVVAGVADEVDPEAVQRLADAILAGAYEGDFDVALERAAAFFRVVATGREQLGEDTELAARNIDTALALQRAAAGWRAGTLR
ncbi:MAG: hypothetical protein ABJA34_11595 [Pseudonocardiales bacterium]